MVGIMGVNQSNAVQVCCRLGLLLVVSAAAADAKLDATRQQPVTRHHLHTFLPGNGLIEKTITIRGGGAIGTNAKTPSKTVAARGGGEEEGASVPNEIFNLVKSIVGAGVLGLPAGMLNRFLFERDAPNQRGITSVLPPPPNKCCDSLPAKKRFLTSHSVNSML